MNAGLLRASALRCGEHRQRRLPGKNDLLIRIPQTSILRRCDFPRAPFPTRHTFVQPVCLLGWLKTSTPKWSNKINLFIFAITTVWLFHQDLIAVGWGKTDNAATISPVMNFQNSLPSIDFLPIFLSFKTLGQLPIFLLCRSWTSWTWTLSATRNVARAMAISSARQTYAPRSNKKHRHIKNVCNVYKQPPST